MESNDPLREAAIPLRPLRDLPTATLTELRTRFSAVVANAVNGPIAITRRGHRQHVILSADAYEAARKRIEAARDAWDARWREQRKEWLRRIGPMLTAAEVRARGERETPSQVVPDERRLIGFDVDGSIFYPAFQFANDGSSLAWVAHVVAVLHDPDTTLQFFGAARPALQGRSYAELLGAGCADVSVINEMLDQADRIKAAEGR